IVILVLAVVPRHVLVGRPDIVLRLVVSLPGVENGKDKNYNVPWTPVTADNVDKLLATRK
ncbi:hypothetical protein AB9F41_35205, partial [Rhizobium leguminosarum]